MFLKSFNFQNEIVVKTINNLLQKEKYNFKRLRKNGYISYFPLKYAEVFEIDNGSILIKIQKQAAMGSIVAIGPDVESNELKLNLLKQKLDEAFLPTGLNTKSGTINTTGVIELLESTELSIEYYCKEVKVDGLGFPVDITGESEIYLIGIIEKIY